MLLLPRAKLLKVSSQYSEVCQSWVCPPLSSVSLHLVADSHTVDHGFLDSQGLSGLTLPREAAQMCGEESLFFLQSLSSVFSCGLWPVSGLYVRWVQQIECSSFKASLQKEPYLPVLD